MVHRGDPAVSAIRVILRCVASSPFLRSSTFSCSEPFHEPDPRVTGRIIVDAAEFGVAVAFVEIRCNAAAHLSVVGAERTTAFALGGRRPKWSSCATQRKKGPRGKGGPIARCLAGDRREAIPRRPSAIASDGTVCRDRDGRGESRSTHGLGSKIHAPGPKRWASIRRDLALARRLLRCRTAELQRPIFFTTTCGQCHECAQERHDSDFLAIHGTTSALLFTRPIVRMWRAGPRFEWRSTGQFC